MATPATFSSCSNMGYSATSTVVAAVAQLRNTGYMDCRDVMRIHESSPLSRTLFYGLLYEYALFPLLFSRICRCHSRTRRASGSAWQHTSSCTYDNAKLWRTKPRPLQLVRILCLNPERGPRISPRVQPPSTKEVLLLRTLLVQSAPASVSP